jgi:hypothetical protein
MRLPSRKWCCCSPLRNLGQICALFSVAVEMVFSEGLSKLEKIPPDVLPHISKTLNPKNEQNESDESHRISAGARPKDAGHCI